LWRLTRPSRPSGTAGKPDHKPTEILAEQHSRTFRSLLRGRKFGSRTWAAA
jgi:hypothetical protein